MQIIESSMMGVRSAFIHLAAHDGTPDFLLFPMLHIGEASFYEDVSSRLSACDIILVEGVKSPTTSLLTASYRYFATSKRLGLVLQNTMPLDHVKARLVHADVSGEEFDERWSSLRWPLRYLISLAAPAYGFYMKHFGTREDIAKASATNLLKSRDEILTDDTYDNITEILLDWRDKHFINVLEEHRQKHRNEKYTIGVLYGAGHMRGCYSAYNWYFLT